MLRKALAFLVLGIIAHSSLWADTFELQVKKLKVTKKNADIFPELELRPVQDLNVDKEPKYRSDYPQKFMTAFGNGEEMTVSFAVDEKRGSGKGFDLLYVDSKGNGDLAKGKKVTGKTSKRSYSYTDTQFSAFEVLMPRPDGSAGFPVQARFSIRKDTTDDSSLYLMPLCVLEGKIAFDGKQQKIIIFDSNCNGVFGETGSLRGSTVAGDRVWIGPGSPKYEAAYAEALPLGKYHFFEDKYYEVKFTENNEVDITTADVPLGTLKVNNPGFLLELIDGGDVLYVSNEKGTEILCPEGNYRVNNASFRCKYKGAIWELEGRPGTFGRSFKVDEGGVTEIDVGAPLKISISADTRPMGNGIVASFDFSIQGSAGETYQYLKKGGKKVDLPEISIRDPKNREVEKGGFEYG